ncbi:hypothetical protein FRACYDRAFT_243746 [Fragilariopsis cylindrus CCMP1102]|uniref:Uncharacterized protein n=1 Tax=Fragilariopsis cylindrus CCMP1102 TaxID=635003 RepID=A0A1E7F2Y6_9STRA|nr:hypothetical protein FRACYDRAFT_243746 [Fragilariopsis cylindrus CCMP1102]|eukprot:OEU12496.1 hypothetical protein FRACYDRAFT_243746 [Fragilariopsis cylindrus CCMP1102]
MMFSNQVIIVFIIALFMMSTSSGFCPRSSSSSSSSSTASASASTTTQLHYISPQDIASTASTASKHLINVVVTTRIPTDVEVQILSDSSHAFMDFPSLFTGSSNNNKNSTGSSKKKTSTTLLASPLRMKYAQFVGRLLWLSCGLVPNHGFHIEEIMIQLVLLGVNMRPIIRSMILLKCINSGDKSNCAEECELELEEFLGINTTDSDSEDILEYNNFLH